MNDRIGKYTLVRRLSIGGVAEAYLATQDQLGSVTREVLIKCILPHLVKDREFTDTFLEEAKNVANLAHPNIISVHEFGWEGTRCYLVMENVPGVELDVAITQSRGLKPSFALKIASEICAGLHYAHTLEDDSGEFLGIIHSDVSPHSILLGLDGSVKIADFGIAKAVAMSQQMHPGSYEGRYQYIAPEQALGSAIDHRTDIHAVGVLLWEMLTGRSLFKRKSLFQTIEAVINERPPPIADTVPGLPSELDDIIEKATAKDPNERYQNCSELQVAIDTSIGKAGLHSTVLALGRYVERSCMPALDFPEDQHLGEVPAEESIVDEREVPYIELPSDKLTHDENDPTSWETSRYQRVQQTVKEDLTDDGMTADWRIAGEVTRSLKGRPTPSPPPEATTVTPLPTPSGASPTNATPSGGTPLPTLRSTPRSPVARPTPSPPEHACSDDPEYENSVTRRHPSNPPSPRESNDMLVPPTRVVMVRSPELDSASSDGQSSASQDDIGAIPETVVGKIGDAQIQIVVPEGGVPDRPGGGHSQRTLPFPVSLADVTIEGRYKVKARRQRTAKLIILGVALLALTTIFILSLRGDIDIIGAVTGLVDANVADN